MMGWVSSYNYKQFLFLVILQDSGEKKQHDYIIHELLPMFQVLLY